MAKKLDPVRISKTMAFLLRHRPEVGNLSLDSEGWVELEVLATAVSKLRRTTVTAAQIRVLVVEADANRFEIHRSRIRAIDRAPPRTRAVPPDIAYHATTESRVAYYRQLGRIEAPGDRPIYLSAEEHQSWRVAHRLNGKPRLLYVDTSRARRHGAKFYRNRRTGLYQAKRIGLQDVLNLMPSFAEQISAGGIPVTRDPEGRPRMALIRVTRRSGSTWEVAKGKLEVGEPPERAGLREVREEMGIEAELSIRGFVGLVRYGFMAPGGLPRLKTVHLYLMDYPDPLDAEFKPAAREGINDVRWFTPREACRAVTHSSLIPVMRRAKRLVENLY